MRVAVLFTTDTDMKGLYKKDWQGRDDNGHAYSVMRALSEKGYKVLEYHANLNLFKRFKSEKHKIDLVFNLVDDGFFSDSRFEAHVPAMLDLLKIKYTGSGVLCLSLCVNKALTKKVLLHHKIPTPRFQVFSRADEKLIDLAFPLFVKPMREDSSVGIRNDSVVTNKTQLRAKVRAILRDYRQPALVEEYIEGREFYVGVLGSKKKFVLPISEVSFNGMPQDIPNIVNYDAKWDEESIEFKNTISGFTSISRSLYDKLVKYSIQAGEHLQCNDYYRVDFRVDSKSRPYVLEVNPNPDISEDAGLAKMARQAGMSYAQMIDYIVRSARSRRL